MAIFNSYVKLPEGISIQEYCAGKAGYPKACNMDKGMNAHTLLPDNMLTVPYWIPVVGIN